MLTVFPSQLFRQKKTNKGKYRQILDEDNMKALIEGRTEESRYTSLSPSDQSRKAIQKLRPMIGALRYMQEDEVAKIFSNQKNRMGAMIGYIDRELHKTPREFGRGTAAVVARPWQEQGLEKKWDAYMDNVFAVAKQRATDFMDPHLASLKAEWESSKKTEVSDDFQGDSQAKQTKKKELEQTKKDMLALIKKTKDEWDKVKDWEMPWTAKDQKDTGEDGADEEDEGEAGQDRV